MISSDTALDSKKILGRKVKLTLSKVMGSPTLAEVEAFIVEQGNDADDPFGALFIAAPPVEADAQTCLFPKLVIKPLCLLFTQFHVSKSEYTGRTFFSHGTRIFEDKRTVKKDWTGTPADLRFHKEQLEAMNFSLLMFNQERLGIKNPKLRIRLRFFSTHKAQQALLDPTQTALLWMGGKERPDNEQNVVIIRKKLKKGYSYNAFQLVVPATLRTTMEIFLEKPTSISPCADEVADELTEAIEKPSEEVPAYCKVATPFRSMQESWAKDQSANLFLKRYWPVRSLGAAPMSVRAAALLARGCQSSRRSVWIAEPIGYWAHLLECA